MNDEQWLIMMITTNGKMIVSCPTRLFRLGEVVLSSKMMTNCGCLGINAMEYNWKNIYLLLFVLIIGCGSKVWMERKAALCSISVPVLCLTLLCILSACSNYPLLGFTSSSAAVLQSLLLSVLCCSAGFANNYSALHCSVFVKSAQTLKYCSSPALYWVARIGTI